jgi:hypothetical protein
MRRIITGARPLALAVAVFCLAVGCGGDDDGGTGPETPSGDWTVLAYMAGNNNLDYSENINSFVIEDLQEMEMVGSTDHLEIVVIISSLKAGGDANVYHVEYHPDEIGDTISSTRLAAWGQKDMSDPQTLTDFLELGLDRYPSEHTMLIIDNHGAGWAGACTDDPAGGQPMTIAEMAAAIQAVDVGDKFDGRFDLVTFHACLMASAEVAYGLRDVADYMVACQFVMPMESILHCDAWLAHMRDHDDLTPEQVGIRIAQDVKNRANTQNKICHMSVLDLSRATALTSRMGDLGDALPTDAQDPLWAEVLDAWQNTHVTSYDDPATVDLRELVTNILNEPNLAQQGSYVETMAQQVLDTINEMVCFTTTNAIGITRGGMNIYMPYQIQQWDPAYQQTAFAASNWDTFVRAFIEGIQGLVAGTLEVNSTPQGAAITVDGEDTGAVTPASFQAPEGDYRVTLTLAGYQPWTQTVHVTAGQTTTVNAQLVEEGGGGEGFTVQGTAAWNDQRAMNDAWVLLYAEQGGQLQLAFGIDIDEGTGQFQGQVDTDGTYWVEVWDDADGDGDFSIGDGWNAIDADGDQQYPTWGDGIAMTAGHTYTFEFTLFELTGGKSLTVHRNWRPAAGGPSRAALADAQVVGATR